MCTASNDRSPGALRSGVSPSNTVTLPAAAAAAAFNRARPKPDHLTIGAPAARPSQTMTLTAGSRIVPDRPKNILLGA